jgi:hypothetical protein
MKVRLFIAGGEDLYIEFFEPEELSQIALVYLSREEVTFSLVREEAWKQYRSSYQTNLMSSLLDQFFEGLLQSSNFTWSVITEEERRVYMIDPSEQRLRLLGLLSGGGYLPNLMHIQSPFVERGLLPED